MTKVLFFIAIIMAYVPSSLGQEEEKFSNSYSDLIEMDGDFYLMTPSPSLDFSSSNNIWCGCEAYYRGVYEVSNDSLFFVRFLGVSKEVNRRYKDSISYPVTRTFIPTSKNYRTVLTKKPEINRSQLEKDDIQFNGGYDRSYGMIRFKAGILENEFYLPDSSETYTEYGKINITYYGNVKIDPKVVRAEDNKTVREFITEEKKATNWGNNEFNNLDYKPYVYYSERFKADLPAGKYYIDFSTENTVFKTDTFEVVEYQEININYNPGNASINSYKYQDVEYKDPSFYGFIYDVKYGNNGWIQSGLHQVNSFALSVKSVDEIFFGSHKKMSLVGSVGGGYSYGVIHQDSNVIGLSDYRFQNYSYASFEGEGTVRCYGTRYTKLTKPRFYIEAGLNYKLPLLFRYVARFDTEKHSDRWMHKFTDLSAVARIGLQNGVSLKAEYRPFNIINSPYPELPKLTIGLTISWYENYIYGGYRNYDMLNY